MGDSTVFADAWFEVGGRNQKQTVRKFTLTQAKGCHELGVLRIRRADTDSSSVFRTGSPVKVVWGRKNSMESTFYGYCADARGHYDSLNKAPSMQTFDVPVLGASMVMKQPFTSTWENNTFAQIVRSIAQSVMFSVDISNADMVYPHLSNPGKSSWALLRRLAERTGNVLCARNTDLYFMDPIMLIKRKGGSSPTFHTLRAGVPETISKFEAEGGDIQPNDGQHKANRYVYGVDPVIVSAIRATSGPDDFNRTRLAGQPTSALMDHLETELVADSAQWAQTLVEGAALRNRFSMRARASLAGDARVSPAGGVMLRGLGTKHSGLWTVEKVVHNLEIGSYSMEAELGRDSSVDTGSLINLDRRVVRQRLDPFDNIVDVGLPGTVLANGRWRSAWGPKMAVAGGN